MADSPTGSAKPSPEPTSHPNLPPHAPPTVPEASGETLAGDPLLAANVVKGAPSQPAQTGDPTIRSFPSLSGFEVLKELGRGGMGVVYLVRHRQMNRPEALKMILAGDHASPADLARFQTEARTVASLSHGNFVQIYDVGELDGRPYLRLEYVSGGNLEDWLDRQLGTSCLTPAAAARHVENLARAMHHMHEKGLIHRDLKPANVLISLPDGAAGDTVKLEECELKISDFGLARDLRGHGANTRGIIGTPAYMAPEQAMGGTVDRRADVYSLGAILYRLLTGRAPHEGDNPMSVLAQLIQPGRDPVPPSQLRPDLPPALDVICLRSLAKDSTCRHSSAKELAEDLRRFLDSCTGSSAGSALSTLQRPAVAGGAPSTVVFGPIPVATTRPRRGKRIWIACAALGAVALIAGYVGYGRWAAARASRDAVAREAAARDQTEAEARGAWAEAKDARDKGDKKSALRSYWKAEEGFEGLHKHFPDRSEYALELARAHIDEGSLWLEYPNAKEAEEDFGIAVELLTKEIALEAAGDDVGLALADAYHHRGTLQESLVQWRPALALYQEAFNIREGLYWKNKNDRAFRRDLARSLSSIGDAQLQLNRPGRARESYAEAAKIRQKLVEEDGNDPEARLQLARSIASMGKYFLWRGDLAGSVKNYADASRSYEELMAAQPAFVLYRSELADACLWLAELHLDRGESGEIKTLVDKARAAFDDLSARGADEAMLRGGRARCTALLARLLALTDPSRGAEEAATTISQLEDLTKYLNAERRQRSVEDLYTGAAARALRGEKEATLRSLKSAVNTGGFRNFARLRLDVAFRPLLTTDGEFKKAVDELEKSARSADHTEEEESESARAPGS
jgi:eukaryotic-like serine/threonine-protein kinase